MNSATTRAIRKCLNFESTDMARIGEVSTVTANRWERAEWKAHPNSLVSRELVRLVQAQDVFTQEILNKFKNDDIAKADLKFFISDEVFKNDMPEMAEAGYSMNFMNGVQINVLRQAVANQLPLELEFNYC